MPNATLADTSMLALVRCRGVYQTVMFVAAFLATSGWRA